MTSSYESSNGRDHQAHDLQRKQNRPTLPVVHHLALVLSRPVTERITRFNHRSTSPTFDSSSLSCALAAGNPVSIS
jgi:hypothetical protein